MVCKFRGKMCTERCTQQHNWRDIPQTACTHNTPTHHATERNSHESQMVDSQVQIDSQAVEESQISELEAKKDTATDGGEAGKNEASEETPSNPSMAISAFQSECANRFRRDGKQEKVRPLATTAAILLEIEKALLDFAVKMDEPAGYNIKGKEEQLALVPPAP